MAMTMTVVNQETKVATEVMATYTAPTPTRRPKSLTLIAIVYLDPLLVDLAEATVTLLEVEQSAKKLVAVEIGPEHVGDVELGVGKLPEKEV